MIRKSLRALTLLISGLCLSPILLGQQLLTNTPVSGTCLDGAAYVYDATAKKFVCHVAGPVDRGPVTTTTATSTVAVVTDDTRMVGHCFSGDGSATAYRCSPGGVLAVCVLGNQVIWTPDVTSGATPTLDVGCGAKSLKTNENANPAVGLYVASVPQTLWYDGAAWRSAAIVPSTVGGSATGTLSIPSLTTATRVIKVGPANNPVETLCTIDGSNNLACPGTISTGTAPPDTVSSLVVWGGNETIADPSVLGSESLTNPNLTGGASWTRSGDMALAADAATYTHATGVGTLQQANAALAIKLANSQWYYWTYVVSAVTPGVSGVIDPSVCDTTGGLSCTLDLTAGAKVKQFHTVATASTAAFLVNFTSTAGGVTLDTFSLKEIQGGSARLSGPLYARGANLNGDLQIHDNGNWVFLGSSPYAGYMGLWLGEATPTVSNYILLSNGSGNVGINSTATLLFAIGGTQIANLNNVAFNLLYSYINAQPGGTVPAWKKYALVAIANGVNGCANANGCWQVNGVLGANKAAGFTQDVVLFQLPAGGFIGNGSVKTAVACTGTATALTGLGTTSNDVVFRAATYNIAAAVSATNFSDVFPAVGRTTTAAENVVASLVTTVNNIELLVAGCEVDYWVRYATLP
jgi:hypothetical protein